MEGCTPCRIACAALKHCARKYTSGLLRPSKIALAVPHVIGAQHFYVDAAISVGRTPRIGIVAQPVLSTQFAVDAIENNSQFLQRVGIEHRAAGGVGDGL